MGSCIPNVRGEPPLASSLDERFSPRQCLFPADWDLRRQEDPVRGLERDVRSGRGTTSRNASEVGTTVPDRMKSRSSVSMVMVNYTHGLRTWRELSAIGDYRGFS